jgi:hypothetical protein
VRGRFAACVILAVALVSAAAWPSRRAEAAAIDTGRAPARVTAPFSGAMSMNPDVGPNCSAAGPPPSARLEVMLGALLVLFANRGGPRRRRRT